ncbi:glycoside hydrolase family 16 protein [Carboxylicivirga litoralis]|uniref:glycoside hydrolase family 16 protein n=1 Tax=Carboxylicivirga litoralis TaxID=2816963 RepID=UPI0021CB1DF9|nr:glycoside hydrolase family 16 protein [Carboxylicivirga sp. A043]
MLLFVMACSKQVDYQLVWSDEFDYAGLPDSSKWSYDTEGNSWAWGNNELQHYTAQKAENAYVQNGHLFISAHFQEGLERPYTSARIRSKGKGDWLYGRVEVRAKLPKGKGLWPSVVMLPSEGSYGQWPLSGEIDIMEHVGYEPDSVFFAIHTEAFNHVKGTTKVKGVGLPESPSKFHNYAVEWTGNKCAFYLDDTKVYVYRKKTNATTAEWPFDKRFHIVLSLAVGGNWGGIHGIENDIFPCQMEVDYVRVYKKNNKRQRNE